MDFDILINNATIVDGTGAQGYCANVGVKYGKIDAIGSLDDATAAHVVDATGLVVSPGFIDVHTHCHNNVNKDILHEDNLVRQGITTVVAGNCGSSGWPVGEHLDKVDANGMKQNYAMLVGHHTVRSALFSDRQPGFLDPGDFKLMQAEVERGMDEGAFGVTVGYARDFETNEEIFAFAEPAGARDGIYASHIRSEDRHLLQAIAEIIELAQHADIAIQISHLKTMNPDNWVKLNAVFALMEEAADRGLRLRADRYPYTGWHGGSTNALPRIAYTIKAERGEWDNLRDPDVIDIVMEELQKMHAQRGGPDKLLFCSMREPRPEVEGKTPAQLAEQWGVDLLEVGIRLEQMGGISAIGLAMSEDNLKRILAHPLVGVGSDSHQEADKSLQTHPRSYGTFPRILCKYTREEGVLTLPEAVYKMTAMPAEHFGFTDRGVLREGLVADLVVFDPATVRDTAEFLNAHQYPEGIPHVIVNGKFAVKDGRTTSEHHGRALRKTGM